MVGMLPSQEETELHILDTFRLAIYQTIYNDRESSIDSQDDHKQELIQKDFIICEMQSSSSEESRAVYRATLYSTPNHTVEIINSLLEKQIEAGNFFANPAFPGLQIDTACPVNLRMGSDPLCNGADVSKPNTDCPRSDPSAKDPLTASGNCSSEGESGAAEVTLPVLVTALVAELFLVVFVGMVVVVVVTAIRKKRYWNIYTQLGEGVVSNMWE
jgi:hypothetical protein